MKKFVILFALIAFVSAAPVSDDEEVKEPVAIVRSESNKNADGSYNFEYEGSDGSFREENAYLVDTGNEGEQALKITGSYKYIDANGDEVLVTYTADEHGFVPVGSIIAKEITDVAQAARDLPARDPEQEIPSRD